MKKEPMVFSSFAEMYSFLRGRTIEIIPIEAKAETPKKKKSSKKKEE